MEADGEGICQATHQAKRHFINHKTKLRGTSSEQKGNTTKRGHRGGQIGVKIHTL